MCSDSCLFCTVQVADALEESQGEREQSDVAENPFHRQILRVLPVLHLRLSGLLNLLNAHYKCCTEEAPRIARAEQLLKQKQTSAAAAIAAGEDDDEDEDDESAAADEDNEFEGELYFYLCCP